VKMTKDVQAIVDEMFKYGGFEISKEEAERFATRIEAAVLAKQPTPTAGMPSDERLDIEGEIDVAVEDVISGKDGDIMPHIDSMEYARAVARRVARTIRDFYEKGEGK
jgi:phenylalanyl-tRNA synthetase beta subunit